MSKWLVIAVETVAGEGMAPPHERTVLLRSLSGNRTREQALVELRKEAKKYKPASFKGASLVVGQDGDGSFWVLPKNGKGDARCNIRLIEQVHP
ncbi:hypothetical protein FGW37_19495 [Streptomyces rectiverticillatus]|uniref:hypothetical protein n=1 Tax=Streptomyces rectiverticillatus TaxID=173860 RepID=UPI0015C386AB|nr:hypothetical protein [Streptomyces rectiverticillatus]QLE73480.1 hypothetical protein FGW37_19495 [Streptomyces rectiverticillatus]